MRESATERLTATAARLFQERGLSRVGVNEIVREADVARMSLYNNFHSKEDLAVAAYTALSETRQAAIDAAIEAAPDCRSAILAVFDLAQTLTREPAFRGCAFINLAAHAQPDDRLASIVRRHKAALHERFARLAAECGAPDATTLARQLLALWDGALADAFIEGSAAAIDAARAAADRLVRQDG